MMTFEEWLTQMRHTGQKPFGTAYDIFAKKAWNAAKEQDADIAKKYGALNAELEIRSIK